jgi:hypothetical protein
MRLVRLTLAGLALPGRRTSGAHSSLAEANMGIEEVQYARRVRPELIRRLYTLDAKGIVDEQLIDEVGYALYARCHSIRQATRAFFGKAMCPRCRSDVLRASADYRQWSPEEPLVCACGWETTWGAYHKTYQRKQLFGGNAYRMFRAFIDRWPQARTPRDKMLAIDWLIHACHLDAQHPQHARPAACNVIEGTMSELIPFLDELAYGPASTEGLAEQRRAWAELPQLARWRRWKAADLERSGMAPGETDGTSA